MWVLKVGDPELRGIRAFLRGWGNTLESVRGHWALELVTRRVVEAGQEEDLLFVVLSEQGPSRGRAAGKGAGRRKQQSIVACGLASLP